MLEKIADLLFDADQAYFAAWKRHQTERTSASRKALHRAEQRVRIAKNQAESLFD